MLFSTRIEHIALAHLYRRFNPLAGSTGRRQRAMHKCERKMRFECYLDQGVSKEEPSRRFGIARRTIRY